MQTWNYEAASIQERDDARAVRVAVDQLASDMPETEVTGAKLYSKTAPLSSKKLRIKGLRWYVTVNIHNLKDNSKAQALYRVWQDQGRWNAAMVRVT